MKEFQRHNPMMYIQQMMELPGQDMGSLAVLARTAEGFEETERLALDGRLATNVSATPVADGSLVIAAGTADGRLRIFR